jgi:2-isopropylmalate synthase
MVNSMTGVRAEPERVAIADTTIRDEHLPSAENRLLVDRYQAEIWRSRSTPLDKRVLVARQLGSLGVDVIEAGFAESSEGPAPLRAVADQFRDGGPVVSATIRTMAGEESLARCWRAVSVAARPRLHLFTAAADLSDPWGRLRMSPARLLDDARRAVARAVARAEEVEFSPPRTEKNAIDVAAEWTEAAIEEGARVINIRTTDEYADPEGFRAVIEEMARLAPASTEVVLSADPFVPHLRGTEATLAALACATAALDAGCRQLKCAFNGIAATPGHVPLELAAFEIWSRNQLGESGLRTGLEMSKLLATAELIAEAKGVELPA